MRHIDVAEFSFSNRLEAVKSALQDLNRLRYQVRRFKNAHRDLNLKDVLIPDLFKQLERKALESLPELQIEQAMPPGLVCRMDDEIIHTALEEVILNACREFKARNTQKPVLSLTVNISHQNLIIRISDNALPVTCTLPPDVFEEDASTYARSNQGTGLGLAIVRASFVQHGGRCSLEINYAADGSRQPGVTFAGELPFQPRRST
jgi:K+-sensing histidine kinase KdpD